MKAIIGGTGIYALEGQCEKKTVATAYGDVTVDLVTLKGSQLVFLARHGSAHGLPPHKINYRANMAALQALGVKEVYATCAVGSMNKDFAPGDMVLLSDFIDFTKNRDATFFEGEGGVKHVDMSDPYCKVLRNRFRSYCKAHQLDLKGEGIYVCTEGPRFETAAEIRMYKMLGGDLVGMTNVPEVVLAKEAGMCYAAVGIVTNWCTGFVESEITLHEIDAVMKDNKAKVTTAFMALLSELSEANETSEPYDSESIKACSCSNALISL